MNYMIDPLKVKGLTLTIVFESQSLNYDENFGNLAITKKFHRGDGKSYGYASRQSIRYSIFVQGVNEFSWKQSAVEAVGSGEGKVIQLMSSIVESEESDLFGYMRTNVDVPGTKDKQVIVTRTTPVRISPAIALEPFGADVEMLTNKYQGDKINESPNIANIEFQRSLQKYTIAVDLHRIGNEADKLATRISPGNKSSSKDFATDEFKSFENGLRSQSLPLDVREKRVRQLLDVLKTLYRDVKGRREDLKPLFVVGGVYDTCNPYFQNIVKLTWKELKPVILPEPINELLGTVGENTVIGMRNGYFANPSSGFTRGNGHQALALVELTPEQAVERIKEMVSTYYAIPAA
jgi:CRISPR-associated protein Cst2